MKFYFREQINKHSAHVYRVAHIVKEEAEAKGRCLCSTVVNPENWALVEGLPKDTHLCRRCERLIFQAIGKS
jgi:hypothetical protein